MNKRKWIWLTIAVVVVIGAAVGIVAFNNYADMESAITFMHFALGHDSDFDSEIYEIQISNVYEQSHPATREDAAWALIAATKNLEATDSQEAIELANKLVELSRHVGGEYSDLAVAIRQFAHDYEISNKKALDLIFSEATQTKAKTQTGT